LEIPKYLSASDIFVLPSVSEGLPVVILEALASGIPVVASRVGGIPDILTDGCNALLVEPANVQALAKAILKLLRDDRLRESLREEGFETVRYVEENDIEKLLAKFVFTRNSA
jgi:glycosyltransferase involved in cell wall biosynthesis